MGSRLFVYIIKKIGLAILTLWGVITIIFFIFILLPDPSQQTLGQRSDVQSLAAVKKEFGMDKPPLVQYCLYLNDLSPIAIISQQGDNSKYHFNNLIKLNKNTIILKYPYLRKSFQNKIEVSTLVNNVLPNTIILALCSFILSIILGLWFGILSAVKNGTWQESFVMILTVLGVSIPSFFAAILIGWLFGFKLSAYTGLNFMGSLFEYQGFKGKVLILANLILPSIALGIRPLAVITQLTRSSMLDVLSFDYIRTAKSKGLSFGLVVWKHGLKNALNPVITAASGWLASMLAGAFFIEYIFNWNGLGKLTVDALGVSDFPVVIGAVIYISLIFLIINIITDFLYAIFDPRVSI